MFAVTHQRLCFVNQSPDEVIRSLFYNKLNESLVTVSVFREDNFSSLKCRSTQLECMREWGYYRTVYRFRWKGVLARS